MSRLLDPIRPYLTIAALVALAAFAAWVWRIDSLRASYKRQLTDVRAEYAAFQTRVVDRTATALRIDRESNARVAAQQTAIIQENSNDYLKARVAELDRLRQRLRDGAAQADPSSGREAGVSAIPVLSSGLLHDGGTAIVDVADAEICTTNTLKLEGLAAAWRAVSAVQPDSGQ